VVQTYSQLKAFSVQANPYFHLVAKRLSTVFKLFHQNKISAELLRRDDVGFIFKDREFLSSVTSELV
jgi:hypothetical protein